VVPIKEGTVYITGLRSFALQVPDVGLGSDFYTDFGLVAQARGVSVVMRCLGRDQDQIVLQEAPRKQLAAVTFNVLPGSLGELRHRVVAAGHPQVDPPPGGDEGLWVRDPDGLFVGLIEDDPAPYRSYPDVQSNTAGRYQRVDRAQWLDAATLPRPRRLGHVIKFSPDIVALERFYLDLLGLRLSDRIGSVVAFWNAGAGDHHIFGAIRSTHPGLHHASFETAGIDEMGMGAKHMAEHGWRRQWGLGRHTLGSNLFVYVMDPWGSWSEYFSDMDQVTDAWLGTEHDVPPEVWAPEMPEEFMMNVEPERVG